MLAGKGASTGISDVTRSFRHTNGQIVKGIAGNEECSCCRRPSFLTMC